MIVTSQEGIRAFEQMLLDACLVMRPPEKLDVAQWADKYGQLSSEGSAEPGKWYTSNAEYQRDPMQRLCDSAYQTTVLMWGSQIGKTQIALFLAAYHIQHDPAPILFIEPTEDLAKVIALDRIEPMIRDTPVLREIFTNRKGKKDTFHKPYPGGQLSLGWANSPSQLASRPIRVLITDEEGRYQANAEGDPVDQARKRLATFKTSRKHLRVSSPGLRRTCRITKAYEQSDKRRYYVPCPQCGHMQTLRFENLHGEGEETYYVCEANGCEITEADKLGMLAAGEWRAENPGGGDGKTAGYQLSSLYSPLGYTWAEIRADFKKCEGIPDKLQVFTNTVLAEPWDEQAEGADLNEVQKHAEPYAAQAPAWVVFVTCGADVQKNRIEGTKWGWGLKDVSGVIEHRIFPGDPLHPEVWADFEAWRAAPVQHESGLLLPTACTLVDAGDGNRTDAVHQYTKRHVAQKVFACKGSSQLAAPVVSEPHPVGRLRAMQVTVGTSTIKDVIYGRLQISEKEKPGYIHFPQHQASGCSPRYFKQLTAEVLVVHQTKGGEEARWENPNKRNEALDCGVYGFGARWMIPIPIELLARQMAATIARKGDQIHPPAPPDDDAPSLPTLPSLASSPASPSQPARVSARRRMRRRIALPSSRL